MIKAEQIPEAVWRVAMMTYHREIRRNPEQAWQLAIAAALTTWPEVTLHSKDINATHSYFVLPLQQENSND